MRHDGTDSILRPYFLRGQPVVHLYRDGKRALARPAALVAEAFCGLPSVAALKTSHRIIHRNGNPSDNRPENLHVLPRRIRSDRDVAYAWSLIDSGLTHKLARKLTGVPAWRLKRRRPPPE